MPFFCFRPPIVVFERWARPVASREVALASTIVSYAKRAPQVAVVREMGDPLFPGGLRQEATALNPSIIKFAEFWVMMDTIERHGYLRAAMSVFGRSAVGAGWSLQRHTEYGKSAPQRHRRVLYDFYIFRNRTWTNIQDFRSLSYKIAISISYLKYFGQAAFRVVRDANQNPLGLDFLHGLVVPNVDKDGNFKSPAFVHYPTKNPRDRVEFANPRDVVFIANPDWRGSVMGGSDIEALTEFALPLDIYLQTAARDYMKNRDKPEVIYELAADMSEEAIENFTNWIAQSHRGAASLGKSAVVVQGEVKMHETRPYPSALPYQQSRADTRDETLAVSGVSGAKLGLASEANALRELRREFHESSLLPLLTLFEQALYEQVNVREFGYEGWQLKFNAPDFLNAVERATVHMRYKGIGVYNANEIRTKIGEQPRTDPNGDLYDDQLKQQAEEAQDDVQNPQGSPPEGREDRPDAPSETGEPTLDGEDPPRGDQHDDSSADRQRMIQEVRLWRTVAINRVRQGKRLRAFRSTAIPADVLSMIEDYVYAGGTDVAELDTRFHFVLDLLRDEGDM